MALVVTEIELREIAVQMGAGDVVVGAVDAALERGEVGLDGLRVNRPTRVLAAGCSLAPSNFSVSLLTG